MHLVDRLHGENKEHARENLALAEKLIEWIPDLGMREHHFASIEDHSKSSKEILMTLFKVMCMTAAVIGDKGHDHRVAHKDRIKDFPVVILEI